jgi:hypothetical protein
MGDLIIIGASAFVAYLFWPGKAKQDDVIVDLGKTLGDLDPDEPDPPEPGEVKTPLQIVQSFVAADPTVGRAYRIKKDEIFYGNNGIGTRALRKHYGREPTTDEKVDYYRATGRVRSNWRLYGVANGGGNTERFNIRNSQGVVVQGTLRVAWLPRHDVWIQAVQAGKLPRRLINWTNGNPVGNAAAIAASGNRTWGTIVLPPIEAVAAGLDVTDTAAFDWPAELYTSAGTTWETWVP